MVFPFAALPTVPLEELDEELELELELLDELELEPTPLDEEELDEELEELEELEDEDGSPEDDEELEPGVTPPLVQPCSAKRPAAIKNKEIFFILTILTNCARHIFLCCMPNSGISPLLQEKLAYYWLQLPHSTPSVLG